MADISIKICGLRYRIGRAIEAASEIGELAKYLRDETGDGLFLRNEDLCLLADLLEVKRRGGRPKSRMKKGEPAAVVGKAAAVMYRFACYCANIGKEGGPSNRMEAKEEVCKVFGICKRDFESIHIKEGHYAQELEKKIREIDADILKKSAGDASLFVK